jgi:hypothetical protein
MARKQADRYAQRLRNLREHYAHGDATAREVADAALLATHLAADTIERTQP